MAQQTAVDWLNNKILNTNNLEYLIGNIDNWIQQAKAMEKKQIMKAVYDTMGNNFDPNMGRAEQYYNETYKSE